MQLGIGMFGFGFLGLSFFISPAYPFLLAQPFPFVDNPLARGIMVAILVGIMVYFLAKFVKKTVALLLNSFLGLVILVALNFTSIKVPITPVSVALTLFGGLLGLVASVILHLLGFQL